MSINVGSLSSANYNVAVVRNVELTKNTHSNVGILDDGVLGNVLLQESHGLLQSLMKDLGRDILDGVPTQSKVIETVQLANLRRD
jgi:hypothetical protein